MCIFIIEPTGADGLDIVVEKIVWKVSVQHDSMNDEWLKDKAVEAHFRDNITTQAKLAIYSNLVWGSGLWEAGDFRLRQILNVTITSLAAARWQHLKSQQWVDLVFFLCLVIKVASSQQGNASIT